MIVCATAYQVEVIDCNSATSVNQFDFNQLCLPTTNPVIAPKTQYTIVQKPRERTVEGKSCLVIRSTFQLLCGVWAHLKLLTIPKIEIVEEMPPIACQQLIADEGYRVPGGSKYPVKMNQETIIRVDTVGVLQEQNGKLTCTGQQARIGGQIIDDVLQITQYRIVIREESFTLKGDSVEVNSAHLSLPCKTKTRSCVTAQGTFLWNEPSGCNLQEVSRISAYRVDTFVVDDESNVVFNITGESTPPEGCPITQLLNTEYPDLFLTKTGEFPPLEVVNLHPDYQIKNLGETLEWRFEKSLGHLEQNLRESVCIQNHQNRHAEPFLIKELLYGLIKGQILYTFTCAKVIMPILEAAACYDRVPLQVAGDVPAFMDPSSKLLTNHASVVACTEHYPMKIHSMEGWVVVNPKLQPSPTPDKMYLPEAAVKHHVMSKGGIYTRNEEQAWEDLISFPTYATALLKSIAIGACSSGGGTCSRPNSAGTQYDLDSLIPSLESLNPMSQIMKWIHEYGDFLALLVLIVWLAQLIMYTTTVVVTYLTGGPPAAAAMLYTLCCRPKKDYDRIRRRTLKISEGQDIPLRPTAMPHPQPYRLA